LLSYVILSTLLCFFSKDQTNDHKSLIYMHEIYMIKVNLQLK
jgi:hypothetical protein